MSFVRRLFRGGTGRDSSWRPVLLLLLVVLVPTIGVVWMMRAAVENERLAVRQRLAEVYDNQLEFASRRVEDKWREDLATLDAIAADEPSAAEAFARAVGSGLAESALILDERGAVAYPAPSVIDRAAAAKTDARWQEAERMEFAEGDPARAARVYRTIAEENADEQLAARAEQAAARSLLRAGLQEEAVAILKRLSTRDNATDAQGRSLAADAELRLVELLDASSADRTDVAQRLVERLTRYKPPSLGADQRRFLMHEMKRHVPDSSFPTLAAEDLAAAVVAGSTNSFEQRGRKPERLQPTPVADVWQAQSAGKRVVALNSAESFRRQLARVVESQPIAEGVSVRLRAPAESADNDEFRSHSLGPSLPGWRLSLAIDDEQSLDTAARDRTAFYLWMAVAIIVLTAALALLVAGGLRRQMRLARLKNDLVATVSHELKTPLASIRLLVDTLLESDGGADSAIGNNGRTREYLQLISQENSRLTRLIDNFLTFSRMERSKQRFESRPIDVAETVRCAASAMAERFAAANAELTVDVQSPLAARGDADALVTVIANLLDNALKYTDGEKRINVMARRDGDRIAVSVADNGIGLSPRAARRVFDRFYQVDQRLSRSQGGCGLGLAIVRFIIEAHGGEVTVESRLGAGSKFTVTLPADEVSNSVPAFAATAAKTTAAAHEQPVGTDH
jgi:signal transduction histidine kinase